MTTGTLTTTQGGQGGQGGPEHAAMPTDLERAKRASGGCLLCLAMLAAAAWFVALLLWGARLALKAWPG